jgi:hypothetical protein
VPIQSRHNREFEHELGEVEVIGQTRAGCCEFVLLTIAMEGK